jgi:hypothetical protein
MINNYLYSNYCIITELNGSQYPAIFIGNKTYEMLGNLARGHMSKSEGVKKELLGIEEVLKGNKEMHSFGGDDWCLVDFKKENSTIINSFDEFEPFEMDSHLILKLLEDWYRFLCAYENNEIPGIIHPSKRV